MSKRNTRQNRPTANALNGLKKGNQESTAAGEESVGGGILFHIVANAVPSALAGLTAGFGMMPGVPPRL